MNSARTMAKRQSESRNDQFDTGEAYEEYLLLLQQRNRVLKKLKEKDEKQLDLERKEQGFSLYLNGANVDLHLSGHHKSRKTKTAGEPSSRQRYDQNESHVRAITAPSKPTRKGWNQNQPDNIRIKSDGGDKINYNVPGVFTGKYEDDFEVYQSYLETQLDEEEDEESDLSSSDEDERELHTYNVDHSDDSDDELDAKLTFTVQDVKALRESLEQDSSIMKSIASVQEELSPAESDGEVEDMKNATGYELEEIEEEIPDILESSYNIEKDISEELIDIEDENEMIKESTESAKSLKTQVDVFELTGAAPKNRPVSSSKRRAQPTSNSAINISQDLLAAIAEENKKLEEYRGKRETQTAPAAKVSSYDPVSNFEVRPATVANTMSEDVINSITEKVRKLGGRQQRKLLKMLAELEATEENTQITEWDSEKDKIKTFLEVEKNDRKFTSPKYKDEKTVLKDSFLTNEEKITPEPFRGNFVYNSDNKSNLIGSQSIEISRQSISKPDNCLEVLFEFQSNWGNEKYIGLTEIEFIDVNKQVLAVRKHDVEVLTGGECSNDIINLINSKTKTTKEKYMWKCCYDSKQKLEILFHVPCESLTQLSKIIVCNYNRSLQDLNIGVKDCRIFIGGELIWSGVVDKGCGNQIFDYSKVISVSECLNENNPASDVMLRSETRTLNRCGENIKHLPDVQVSIEDLEDENVKEEEEILKIFSERPTSQVTQEHAKLQKKYSDRPSSGNSKPVWLEDVSKSTQKSKDPLDFLLAEDLKPKSRPSSGRRSQISTPDVLEEPKRRRPTSGRRSQTATPDLNEEIENSKKDLDDLFDLNAKPIKVGRRGVLSPESPRKTKQEYLKPFTPPAAGRISPKMINMPTKETEILKSERQKFKEMVDLNLEQSFQSIDNFKFHHLGRLTATLDDDDDLQSLLEPIRNVIREEEQHDYIETERVEEGSNVESEALFELPLLPRGKELILNIKTTWGDRHYVGLNGIEVFSSSGKLVKVKSIQASPCDINILAEYEGDPRVVSNLLDDCYLTRDDLHLWLTPFTIGGDHLVELKFQDEIEVAMIRIWNYNKSRIHSTRGARFVEMALDGKLIFIGEIARASGVLSNEDPYGDTILFTTDEEILELVASNDFTYEVDDENDEEEFLAASGDFNQRPTTADKAEAEDPIERPFTCPKSRQNSRENARDNTQVPLTYEKEERDQSPDEGFMQCRELTLFFSATWGDLHYLGITGLEILGETFEKIPLTIDMLEASPKDLNDLDDYEDDDRTLDNLINDVNVTMSDENMWMIPFEQEGAHLLKITFNQPTIVTGLRVWNYNKSLDDTFRGVKIMHIYLDDHDISPEDGFLIRKGPGHCHFDYAQDILFNPPESFLSSEYPESSRHRKINLHKIINEYETIMMPCGFVFQFKLFSSWGDAYYIGLNGIEVYDKNGEIIKLSDNNITAYPHSVNILPGVSDDVRTPDKLIDEKNNTHDGRHMWMAPIFPGQVNIVYIVFDEPVTISMIKLWNYSKTPARGVRQFGLLVDDLLVYSGILPQTAMYARAIIPGIELPVTHNTILFTDDEEIALKEKKHLLSSTLATKEQNIQLTNECSVLQSHHDKNQTKTSVDSTLRPMTSVTSGGKLRR